MGRKQTRILSCFIIILIFLLNCNAQQDNSIKVNFTVLNIEDIYMEDYYGEITGANNNNIYFSSVRRKLYVMDIITKEARSIGEVGESPEEYRSVSGVIANDNIIYIGDLLGKVLIFDSSFSIINSIKISSLINKFTLCDDTIIVSSNPTVLKNFFSIYDIQNMKEINKFGEGIEYPNIDQKHELYNNGVLTIKYNNWDAKDSILVWYDYYNNELRLYDVYKGELITTFGRSFNKWSTPPTFISEGDQYHPKTLQIVSSPCFWVEVTDNYFYVTFQKLWEVGWGIDKSFVTLINTTIKEKEYLTNNFYFIDIYSRIDFQYLGTLYPFNDYIYNKEEKLRFQYMNSDNDSVLHIFLTNFEGMSFRKITIMVNLNDSIDN